MSHQAGIINKARLAIAMTQVEAVAQLLWRYILALAVATFLSLSYFSKYESAGPGSAEAPTIQGAVVSMVKGLVTESAAAGNALRILLTATPRGVPEETPPPAEAPHAPQKLDQLLLKVCVVISLTFLWFYTFGATHDITGAWKSKPFFVRHSMALPAIRRAMVFVSLLPAVPFILSMRGAYEPAVFVMALVAILVAAEHYGGLRESKQELEEKTNDIVARLEKTGNEIIEKLEKTAGTLNAQLVEKTTDITRQLGTMLNADGLAEWRSQIYDKYRKAFRRIDAVVRFFDIDAYWWYCAPSAAPWVDYVNLCRKDPDTLFNTLSACEANIQFVCDFPMPFVGALPDKAQRAKYFRSFLGLAYTLVVFEKVRRERDEEKANRPQSSDVTSRFFPYARVIVSNAPTWMHVIDDVVYQVIERGAVEYASVRELSLGAIDPRTSVALNEWARRNVRQFAHRGARAEEQVCTVLRYQALKERSAVDPFLHEVTLAKLLTGLGMDAFLELANDEFRIVKESETKKAQVEQDGDQQESADKKDKEDKRRGLLLLSETDATNACVRIFTEFLLQRMSADVLAVHGAKTETPRVSDLIYEVM